MDYKTLYPWAPQNVLDETSSYTSQELIINGCHFRKEDDTLNIVSCRDNMLWWILKS